MPTVMCEPMVPTVSHCDRCNVLLLSNATCQHVHTSCLSCYMSAVRTWRHSRSVTSPKKFVDLFAIQVERNLVW